MVDVVFLVRRGDLRKLEFCLAVASKRAGTLSRAPCTVQESHMGPTATRWMATVHTMFGQVLGPTGTFSLVKAHDFRNSCSTALPVGIPGFGLYG